ncbi:MAG: META domain-containing protein [Ignavibacteriae bacterium]|nr:META domain-containing protein [Ignavibacteriota bacterium]
MKYLLIIIFILLVSTVYSQDEADFKNGIDFVGSGTEPFWGIKIDFEKGIFFNSAGDELKFETGIPVPLTAHGNSEVTFTADAEKYKVKVQICKDSCNDGMSDIIYPYSVKVFITEVGKKKTKELSGCGSYTFDHRLNDIWALDKFKDSEIKKDSQSKTRPYIEIHIRENRIGGSTGCNEFWGLAEVMGDKITISNKFTLTKIACDDDGFESNFINALSGKTLNYKIEKLKLYLIENDIVIMEFNKID